VTTTSRTLISRLPDRSLEVDLLPELEAKGVGVINACALGMGLLSERGPPDWHPASGDIRAACRVAVDYCKERGFDIAKLALHFSLHSSSRIPVCLVSAPVLKYMTQNVEAVWSALSPDEEVAIRHLRENIFGKLEKGTWEGREVDKYREDVAVLRTKDG